MSESSQEARAPALGNDRPRPYEAPVLRLLGGLAELTKGAGFANGVDPDPLWVMETIPSANP